MNVSAQGWVPDHAWCFRWRSITMLTFTMRWRVCVSLMELFPGIASTEHLWSFLLQRALQSSLSNRVLLCLGKCIIDILCIMSIKLMFFLKDFSCFMCWIRLCVPSWSSTLTCLFGIRLMRNPWTCLWRPSWTCECYVFQCLLCCAWSALIVRASRSSTDEFLMKEYLVNKNIVHMIDDIFWHMPFKNPTHP